MTRIYTRLSALAFLVCFAFTGYAQSDVVSCPELIATSDTVVCTNDTYCHTVKARFPDIRNTTTYRVDSTNISYSSHFPFDIPGATTIFVNQDDRFSSVINLPFNFCFYGVTYNKVVIGANGILSFNIANANNFCTWSIGGGFPSAGYHPPSIGAVYHDIDPSIPSTGKLIQYAMVGAAPCRKLIVNYKDVAHFNSSLCPGYKSTFQIVLYENTNVIDVYIKDKPACTGWNGGKAILGVQNAGGTQAVVVPGKNATVWGSANMNAAYRFIPDGSSLLQSIVLLRNGELVETGVATPGPAGELQAIFTQACVPLDSTFTFEAKATYISCSGFELSASDLVTITNNEAMLPPDPQPDVNYCQFDASEQLSVPGLIDSTLVWYATETDTTPLAEAPTPSTDVPGTFTWYVAQGPHGDCESERVPVVVKVHEKPTVNVTPDLDTICLGESVLLTATGADNFSWEPATGLSDAHSATPTASPTATTTYVVYGSMVDSFCAPGVDTAVVAVYIAPTVSAGLDDTTCLGTTIQLLGLALPNTQDYNYTWSGATGIYPPDNNIATFDPPGEGTHTLVLSATPVGGNACPGFDTVEIFVLPNDFLFEATDTTICFGNCAQVTAEGHELFSYLWSPATGITDPTVPAALICPPAPDTTTYTLTASYPNCPDIVKSFTITTEPQPSISVGRDLEKCQWDTLHLHAVVTPDNYNHYAYQWAPDTFLNVTNMPDVIFSGDSSRWITATVTTPNGCTATDSLYVLTHLGNFGNLVPLHDTGICIGESVALEASGGVLYEWSPAIFLSDTLAAGVTSTPTTDVSYTVLVTDQYGCKDTLNINIEVYPSAVVDLGDTIHLYPGDSVVMNPIGNASYFSWFPHLGLSNPNIANPVAMPSVNTRYTVTASTERGCVTKDSVDVIVHLDSELDMPNAFVPGSGPNGTIKAVHLGIAELKYLRIFNRWGEQIFETKDINAGWDGTINGKPQPMGVYIYTVEGKTYRGKEVKKQGNITLIR